MPPQPLPDAPRPGRRFLHARFITEDRKPEVCKVTRVTRLAVFYRVGIDADGSGGGKYKCESGEFAEKVKEWLD